MEILKVFEKDNAIDEYEGEQLQKILLHPLALSFMYFKRNRVKLFWYLHMGYHILYSLLYSAFIFFLYRDV